MGARESVIELDGGGLRWQHLRPLAEGSVRLGLARRARRQVERARQVVEEILARDITAYGVNTGFGRFCQVRISASEVRALQRNLILSHGAGVGAPLTDAAVRLCLALRANTLACGHSGVRVSTLERLLDLYNLDVLPWIPEQGSVGASGDLAPLAHLAQVLIGEGRARVAGGRWSSGRSALRRVGLDPVELEAKEGLALINGVQVSCAVLALALLEAERLLAAANFCAALSLEALLGSPRAFDPRIQAVRPHPGQAHVAAVVRRLLRGSAVVQSHRDCARVQDAYSLRCVPQVHGAVADALDMVRTVLLRECNSASDNPLVFPAEGELVSGGNFHGAPIAYMADLLSIVLVDLGSIAERRIERLVNPDLSGGLPAFLSARDGLESGFMMAQVTAAALVSETKGLAHPASVDSIPTSAGTEDHVSMSTIAARKALAIAGCVRQVLGIELLVAADAFEFHRPLRSGKALEAGLAEFREHVPRRRRDRVLTPEMQRAAGFIHEGFLDQAGGARS